MKRIFFLSEDFDGTLAGRIENFDQAGNRTSREDVDLSQFPNNIVEEFFAPKPTDEVKSESGESQPGDEPKGEAPEPAGEAVGAGTGTVDEAPKSDKKAKK